MLRYLAARAAGPRGPWATWAVNTVGSGVVGAVLGLAGRGLLAPAVVTAVGAGFCGGLTTYSTLAHETLRLARQPGPQRWWAVGYPMLTLVAGVAAVAAGWWFTAGYTTADLRW